MPSAGHVWLRQSLPPRDQHDIHRQTAARHSEPALSKTTRQVTPNPFKPHSPLYPASPERTCVRHPGLRYQVTGNREAQLTMILGCRGQGHGQPQPRPSSGAAKSQTPHLEAPAAKGTGQTLCEQP